MVDGFFSLHQLPVGHLFIFIILGDKTFEFRLDASFRCWFGNARFREVVKQFELRGSEEQDFKFFEFCEFLDDVQDIDLLLELPDPEVDLLFFVFGFLGGAAEEESDVLIIFQAEFAD